MGSSNARGLVWIPLTDGASAKHAVVAGMDSGSKVYVARAAHNGGIIPGKLHMGHSSAYVPYGGIEFAKTEYEVLTAPPGTLSWVDAQGDDIPGHAVEGGVDPSGDTYYIARVYYEGSVTVGKVHPCYGLSYVPYGGQELEFPEYEILVRNAYGRALNV